MSTPMSNPVQYVKSLPSITESRSIQSFHGRFTLQYKNRFRKQKNVYGSFKLNQNNTNTSLELRGLLSQTIAIICESPNGITLELPNHKIKNISDVDKLMQNILGFPLSLSELRFFFLQQILSPSLCKRFKNTDDMPYIYKIKQSNWKIDCIEYVGKLQTHNIKRLNIMHITPSFSIKLVFDY